MKITLIIISFFVINCNLFAQSKKFKIIDIYIIEYYNVYRVVDTSDEDKIIIFLGCNSKNQDYKEINLCRNKTYEFETIFTSSIKIEPNKYLFCKPGVTKINNIEISQKDSLPILITEYKEF